MLLRGAEDRRIQDFFIQQAFPPRELVEPRARAPRAATGATARELMAQVNLGRGRVDALLKVLDVEGAVDARRQPLVARGRQRLEYDAERYARVTALRRARAGGDGGVRRRRPLPDAGAAGGARRPRPAGLRPLRGLRRRRATTAPLDPALVREAALLLRSRPIVLETKKMAPDESGAMRKIPEDVRAEEGRALARLGDGGWDPVVQAGRRAGRFDGELVGAAAEVVRAWRVPVAWVAAVPSRRSGDLVPDFARRLADALGLPFADAIERVGDARRSARWPTRPSRSPTCAAQFAVAPTARRPCLLVDDVRFSGWTLAMVAGQLRRRGAPAVYPLALTSAF